MARFDTQVSLEDTNPEYAAFVEKFKPKKTTDDCYTPEIVYNAIAEWAAREYGFDLSQIVRPFWPGGDYERYDYPDGCVVLDNPPFSILTDICKFYNAHGVRFFLFAPSLTVPIRDFRNCAIVSNSDITYENGASVKTAFITNMERDYIMRTAPELTAAVKKANDENQKAAKRELPKYSYPDCIISAALCQRLSIIDYRIRKDEAAFIGAMDSQRAVGKSIFGGGLLLSERAAAERAAAERAVAERAVAERAVAERAAATRWTLSDREKEIRRQLARKEENHA